MTKTELSENIFPLIPTFTIEQCLDDKWFI